MYCEYGCDATWHRIQASAPKAAQLRSACLGFVRRSKSGEVVVMWRAAVQPRSHPTSSGLRSTSPERRREIATICALHDRQQLRIMWYETRTAEMERLF